MPRIKDQQIIRETTRRQAPRRVWCAVLIGAVVSLLATASIGQTLLSRRWAWYDAKAALIRTRATQFETLILGDSSGLFGVIADSLADCLGGEAANLCTLRGISVLGNALFLGDAIETAGSPERVVIVVRPEYYGFPANYKLLLNSGLVPYREALSHWVDANLRKGGGGFGNGLDMLLPWYLGSSDARNRLVYFGVREQNRWSGSAAWVQAIRENNGTIIIPDSHRKGLSLQQLHEAARRGFTATYELETATGMLIDRARRDDFEVYFALGPVDSTTRRYVPFVDLLVRLTGYLDSLTVTQPSAHLVLREPLTFPDSVFFDDAHLTETGARLYTRALADSILAHERALALDRN